ncbi:Mutator mutT protein (7,8-dihydro-8-oxoguanine-triphosphatase) [hydrothermal vent metagenome]|uniref:8-oxo-dGTP diphosphatase n=1 Tax=hydrothermal vent metagenome TaxID=652676 RepID=A0A3B0ZEH1_9ZZZZ
MKQKVHVAVGLIRNKDNQYLISKRHTHLHQGGLWEFPGGKVEANETVYDALCRELHEELNLTVKQAKPLLRISYPYPDKDVCLDVWLIDDFTGDLHSPSEQAIHWAHPSELLNYSFPAANKAILSCITLPESYVITGNFKNKADYIQHFKQCLNRGFRLIQLRSPMSDLDMLIDLANLSRSLCEKENAKLIVNADANFLLQCDIAGIHLNRHRLFQYNYRPIHSDKILTASVHNLNELQQAIKIEVDFIVVSPVLKTTSHPDAIPLGWSGFEKIINESSVPIFALGGMKQDMLVTAKKCGAFGIAAISEFWGDEK